MASAAARCFAVILVLQLCVCLVAGTRIGDFERSSDVTNAATDSLASKGNRHGRSLLQGEPDVDADPVATDEPSVASAPAPAIQPRIGADSGPMMTPAPTSRSTPAATAASVFSTATTVPAITSVATLSAYATVAAFDTTEQTRFCAVLEANILKAQGVVANCTISNVVLGSVKVSNTLAFTGSDTAAAEAARNSVATALSSSDSTSYFGNTFGEVSVSDVETVTTANPTAKSGAAPLGASLVGIMGGLTFLALSLIAA